LPDYYSVESLFWIFCG